MNFRKNNGITFMKLLIVILIIMFVIAVISFGMNNNSKKIYFNVPASWDEVYAYISDESTGEFPGVKLTNVEDYIYSLSVTNSMLDGKNINDLEVTFNNGVSKDHGMTEGKEYSLTVTCEGYNKIYNLESGIGGYTKSVGEWVDYDKNLSFGKIPTTNKKIKNVIYMIGDGMGENHIKAGAIYKGEQLNIQKIKNVSDVKTASISTVTDSAAGATALFAGKKAVNYTVGLDKNGDNAENLMEYTHNTLGMKSGFVCTEILCHATPASFSVHNVYRYNYNQIAPDQIRSCADVMLGGGRMYFAPYQNEMNENGWKWVNDFSEMQNVNSSDKVIGTFAEGTIGLGEEPNRTSLALLTQKGIEQLENEDGFLLMVEGSDIDMACHNVDMDNMLIEMIDFDDAVEVAMKYVDNHEDTLLVITADHETGGVNLDGVNSKSELTNALFKNPGGHTETDVKVFAYGKGAEDLTKYDVIDNTSIYKFIKQELENCR